MKGVEVDANIKAGLRYNLSCAERGKTHKCNDRSRICSKGT